MAMFWGIEERASSLYPSNTNVFTRLSDLAGILTPPDTSVQATCTVEVNLYVVGAVCGATQHPRSSESGYFIPCLEDFALHVGSTRTKTLMFLHCSTRHRSCIDIIFLRALFSSVDLDTPRLRNLSTQKLSPHTPCLAQTHLETVRLNSRLA